MVGVGWFNVRVLLKWILRKNESECVKWIYFAEGRVSNMNFRLYNIHLHYIKLVPSSQRTLLVFIIKPYLLILFREIIDVIWKNHKEHINGLCGRSFGVGGTYIYHRSSTRKSLRFKRTVMCFHSGRDTVGFILYIYIYIWNMLVNNCPTRCVYVQFSHLVSLHLPAYEDGTDRVFRNVGI
jgi:hypothetical protein